MDAQNAHVVNAAARRERLVELRDLVSLRKIGIEVILSREYRLVVDLASRREGHAHRQLHGAAIQYRQRAGIPKTDGTDVRVRRRPEFRRATAEDLRPRQQTRMDFEADDGFPHSGLII